MNCKLFALFIVSLLLSGAFGAVFTAIFSSAGLEYVISFLSKLFIAIFFGSTLGNMMPGVVIGLGHCKKMIIPKMRMTGMA